MTATLSKFVSLVIPSRENMPTRDELKYKRTRRQQYKLVRSPSTKDEKPVTGKFEMEISQYTSLNILLALWRSSVHEDMTGNFKMENSQYTSHRNFSN